MLRKQILLISQNLQLDNADGIIIGSKEINSDVEKYLKSLDKPVLGYQGEEDYVDAYNEFYDNLLQQG